MSGYEWRPCKKGEKMPATAVLAGTTSSDGPNFVCRVNNECGKVNLDGGNVNNFWCHHNGKSESGDILVVKDGYVASWEYKKKGDSIPDGAVLAGSTSGDGDNYACRNGGAAGKVNLEGGRVNNFWIQGNFFSKGDGDICCVRPRPGGGSQPAPHHEEQHQEHQSGGGGGGGHHAPPSGPTGVENWNPDADCDGSRAEDRMRWLMDNQGKSMDDAKAQVMREFPLCFAAWNPDADCDGCRAEDRMRWLMDNQGKSMDDAKVQVMQEFPKCFRDNKDWWSNSADCDGMPAGDRARWLMENEGYSENAARIRIKTEFPKNFRAGGDHINNGKFPHCMSLVDTPSGPRLKIEVIVNADNVGLVAVHYQVNDGAPMNFDIRQPEAGKTYSHTTPDGGGYPVCRQGDRVSYWLAAEINGLISEEPEGACPNPAARMHWNAHF